MITLYVVRHGETLFNVQHKIQGWCDSPLTSMGIQQAKRVHQGLLELPFEQAYCSTSERCMDTAQLILEGRDIPLYPKKYLKELNFGEWEGESEELIFSHQPKEIYEIGFAHIGGETLLQLRDRLMEGLRDIVSQGQDGNILIVTHGGAIRGMIEAIQPGLLGMKDAINNCSITRIAYDGSFHMLGMNEEIG